MPQITATILYVNNPKPGGNPNFGSIKTDDPAVQRISVPVRELHQFRRGGVYTIDYDTTDRGFFNFNHIVSEMKQQAYQPQPAYQPPPPTRRAPPPARPRSPARLQGSGASNDMLIFV